MMYRHILRPLLFSMDPENAHDLAMRLSMWTDRSEGLRWMAHTLFAYVNNRLEQDLLGLRFRNPVGIAAGFDKNGRIVRALQALGFGFVEIGSITAKPSVGNLKPRMFRLPEDGAIINRMGLNNDGADVIVDRLDLRGVTIPVGINIAKTHDPSILGDAAIDDYVYSFLKAEQKADYIMVNISCPNTAEGITFEQREPLSDLMDGVFTARKQPTIPVLVKFSPDVDFNSLDELVGLCLDAGVAGFAVSNTSTQREGLLTSNDRLSQIGRGGLSGRPLCKRAEHLARRIRHIAGSEPVVIGVGGIDGGQTAMDRLRAGANLVQVYTGLVYEGPGLPSRINRHIVEALDAEGLDSVDQYARWWAS